MSQFLTYTIKSGDTIQVIAQKYGLNWTDIVELNGLTFPYIDTTILNNSYQGVDTVAKLGDSLVIPTQGTAFPTKTNGSSQELEKYIFGADLDIFSYADTTSGIINLESEGQLSSDVKGDVKLCEGLSNLRQQLIIRLGTEKGALLLHPEFGSNILKYIGVRITEELLTKIKLEAQECILSDPRVESISNLQIASNNTSIRVEVDIFPIPPYSSFSLRHTYSK